MSGILIDILCRVVDNFGDIGVVFRLSRALLACGGRGFPSVRIRLAVDGLDSFAKINDRINPELAFQECDGMAVYDWNRADVCSAAFSSEFPSVILECFQCGRPDWLETLLFDRPLPHDVDIIMIDYLTAEDYAGTFHKLPSITRNSHVRKVNFMPGFTELTGGLIIEDTEPQAADGTGGILFFCYPGEWRPLLEGLASAVSSRIPFFAAPGAGFASVDSAFRSCGDDVRGKFDFIPLEFMNQQDWDRLMYGCRILFVRGEESLSRACLSGIPFVWHAYPQSDDYQLVKVEALLGRMRPFFDDVAFSAVRRLWLGFNSPSSGADLRPAASEFMRLEPCLRPSFRAFSQKLRKNGNLASNLMTFITQNIIICGK